MATKEEISMVGFEIVAYAGDAQTDLLAALDAAREGDFEKAEQLHKDASDALIGAHDTQTKLLSQEAGGGEMEMTFIMAHAQDTLMTTMILEKQTRFTIDAYKRIADLTQNDAWDQAARFFWNTVVNHRSVCIGGNSVREHFHPADNFTSMLNDVQGPETCNTYNMLLSLIHI